MSFASQSEYSAQNVILALDTATPYLTLALWWPQGELEFGQEVGRAHAELLADQVRILFDQAGLPFAAQQIVIGTGPGSYTGVRIGASYALGLGRVWNAPVYGVPTLEGMIQGEGQQAVSLDARKGKVYSAIYQAEKGRVEKVIQPVAKRSLEEFDELAQGLPHHQDTALSGLALLRAGLAHGQQEWALAYM